MVDTLKSAGPFTVFAPTDEAFAKVRKEALEGKDCPLYVLPSGLEEVNEVSELTVNVHEYKVGRTIEFLQFEVRIKPHVNYGEI